MTTLSLTESAKLTKGQRRGGWVTLIIGLAIFSVISNLVIQAATFFPEESEFLIQLYFYPLIILAVLLYSKIVEKRTIQSLGLYPTKKIKYYLLGAFFGFLMVGTIVIFNLLAQSISISLNNEIDLMYLVLLLFGFCIQSFAEELLFKGYMMNTIASMSNMTVGIAINSLIFSINHAINPNVTPLGMLNIFLLGLFLSLLFFYYDNLYLVSSLHGSWNFLIGVLGLPVSGKIVHTSLFETKTIKDSSTLNGGSFGLEGGLLTMLVLLICIGICFYFIKREKR